MNMKPHYALPTALVAVLAIELIGSWRVLNLKATTGDKVAYPLGERWRVTLPLPPRGFGYCSSMRREKHQPHRR